MANELNKQELIAQLRDISFKESQKPIEEIDCDLINECSALISELQAENNTSAASAENKEEFNIDINTSHKRRSRKKISTAWRKAVATAATLIISFNIFAFYIVSEAEAPEYPYLEDAVYITDDSILKAELDSYGINTQPTKDFDTDALEKANVIIADYNNVCADAYLCEIIIEHINIGRVAVLMNTPKGKGTAKPDAYIDLFGIGPAPSSAFYSPLQYLYYEYGTIFTYCYLDLNNPGMNVSRSQVNCVTYDKENELRNYVEEHIAGYDEEKYPIFEDEVYKTIEELYADSKIIVTTKDILQDMNHHMYICCRYTRDWEMNKQTSY